MGEKQANIDTDGLAAASAPYTEAGSVVNPEFSIAHDDNHHLERGLKSRHIQFLALGTSNHSPFQDQLH